MSAASDDGFATRRAELALLADALDAWCRRWVCASERSSWRPPRVPTVGPGADGPEIGWAPVDLAPDAATDRLFAGLPERLTVLHWHGDAFDLSPGAHRLAGSVRYPIQAFRVGATAWGVQFHVEVTAAAVEGMVRAFPEEAALAAGGAAAIRRTTPEALAASLPGVTWSSTGSPPWSPLGEADHAAFLGHFRQVNSDKLTCL